MGLRTKLQTLLLSIVGVIFLTTSNIASELAGVTPVEHESQWRPKGQGDSLGTIPHNPSKLKKPFFMVIEPVNVSGAPERAPGELFVPAATLA